MFFVVMWEEHSKGPFTQGPLAPLFPIVEHYVWGVKSSRKMSENVENLFLVKFDLQQQQQNYLKLHNMQKGQRRDAL